MVRCALVILPPPTSAPVAGAVRIGPAVQRVAAEDLQLAAIERQVRISVAWLDVVDV